MFSRSTFASPSRKPRLMRLLAVILAVVLLHLLFFQWATGRFVLPSLPKPEDNVITTALLAPPAPQPAVQSPPKPRPHLHHPAPPPPRPAPDPTPASVTPEPPPVTTDESAPAASSSTDAPASDTGAQASVADTASTPAAPAQEPPATTYKINPPPSAELKYDVQALRSGQTVYGNGKIRWQSDGHHYRIDGEAGILFFTVLSFSSEGTIDEFGVSPVIYSEKRFRRSETATHFHRERNTVSFSASTLTYPRKGGEQDRASIVWQLAGIARGDSSKFTPGADLDIVVAGVRDEDTWRLHIVGQEEIDIGTGKVMAWHVLRAPRPGSYDQKIDIWFAPQQEWYPVRLRFTETNGDYLDMSLSTLTQDAH